MIRIVLIALGLVLLLSCVAWTAGPYSGSGGNYQTDSTSATAVQSPGDVSRQAQPDDTVEAVPEPATFVLIGLGLIGLVVLRKALN